MGRRIALYGGSFNPPHVGHQAVILHVLECADVDQVLVAPVYKHPDGKDLAPYDHRCAMVDILTEPFSDTPLIISQVEERAYQRYGTGHTVDTIKKLFDEYSSNSFMFPLSTVVLVLGSDLKVTLPNWAGYDELKAMIDDGRVELFWVQRDIPISSTLVRENIREGKSTQRQLPPRLRRYIDHHGLYR